MSANDIQIGGNHYKTLGIQPWDAAEAWGTQEEFDGYMRMTAIAYLARAGHKDSYEADIRKAHHTLTRLIESWDNKTSTDK